MSKKEPPIELLFKDEAQNLGLLTEESSEVIQAVSKITRFGIDDYHPKNKMGNRQKLEEEIGHFLKIVDILIIHGTVTAEGIERGREAKIDRLLKWYNYNVRDHSRGNVD